MPDIIAENIARELSVCAGEAAMRDLLAFALLTARDSGYAGELDVLLERTQTRLETMLNAGETAERGTQLRQAIRVVEAMRCNGKH